MVGIAADKRSPDNLVPDNILKQFDGKLASIEELCKYVDKYIAHSATPDSRKAIPDEIKEALGKVLNAHKIICETASFIGNKLLFYGFGDFLPGPRYGQFDQFDIFEYLKTYSFKRNYRKTKRILGKISSRNRTVAQIVV